MSATTILSDNGVTSGSAGVKTSGGTDGTLQLQTTTAGGTATTALSIDNSQVITFTNQPTYTGGTANGVAYLNGSKVLTTGSALTFDGTNLGLGVTPSAWGSTWKALQLNNGSVASNGNVFDLPQNAYFGAGGSYIYTTTAAASIYRQNSGAHSWFTAPSGTAGNAISFTQAMTLNNTLSGLSGNLLVGASPSINRLWSSGTVLSGLVDQALVISTAVDTINHRVGVALAPGGRVGSAIMANNVATSGGNEDSNLEFWVTKEGNTNSTLAGQFDASGNLLVGTTTPVIGKMTVNGGITTTGYPQFNVYSTNSSTAFEWVLRSGTEQQFYVNNASVMARLTSSGVWTNASDARYKENIRPATYGLAELMQLHPRAYNVIGSTRQEIGFVAQEVEPLIPELVESTRNSVTEQDRLTLSYGQLSAVIVKAIQEQQAIIEQLKADVAALKGN